MSLHLIHIVLLICAGKLISCDALASILKASPSSLRRDKVRSLQSDADDDNYADGRHEKIATVVEKNQMPGISPDVCYGTLSSNNGIFGVISDNVLNVTFDYEVTTKTAVNGDTLANDYLPKIEDLFSQSFFKNGPLCCAPNTLIVPRNVQSPDESVISNIVGVDATSLGLIDNGRECDVPAQNCTVVNGTLRFYTDQNAAFNISDQILNRVIDYLGNDLYKCAHSSIDSLAYREPLVSNLDILNAPPLTSDEEFNQATGKLSFSPRDPDSDSTVLYSFVGVVGASMLAVISVLLWRKRREGRDTEFNTNAAAEDGVWWDGKLERTVE